MYSGGSPLSHPTAHISGQPGTHAACLRASFSRRNVAQHRTALHSRTGQNAHWHAHSSRACTYSLTRVELSTARCLPRDFEVPNSQVAFRLNPQRLHFLGKLHREEGARSRHDDFWHIGQAGHGCTCVRACVRACVRVCVRVCVCMCMCDCVRVKRGDGNHGKGVVTPNEWTERNGTNAQVPVHVAYPRNPPNVRVAAHASIDREGARCVNACTHMCTQSHTRQHAHGLEG